MKRTNKILALVLVLMMVLPMFSIFASAAAPEVLYLTPNANWKQGNARFAAYFFGNGEKWVSMTDSDKDGVYEVAVPAGYPNVIFCRMNPSATDNNWNNKWNQTADLTIPTSGANHYTVKEDTWDSGGGTWSTYGSTCMHTNLGAAATCTTPQLCLDCGDPVVSELGHTYNSAHLCTRCNCQATFTVAGSGAHLGTEWDTGNTANDMTYADGVYTKVYTNVAAGSYALKVVRDHAWGTAYPSADKAYTVATSGSTVTVTLKGTTVTITVEAPHAHAWSDATCTEAQKCECGETQGEALGHDYVAGVCSRCQAVDPDYVAPHVNTLVVGDTNKIVIDDSVDNGYGYYVTAVVFNAEESAYYSFVGEGLTIWLYDLENNLLSMTGAANLEAGYYTVFIASNTPGTTGEYNVAVTKAAWVNSLALGDNKILITDALDNGAGYYIVWVPFEVTEKDNYAFGGEGVLALVYDSAYQAVEGTELEVGTYYVCVAFLTPATTGVATVTVEKTTPPVEVEDPALALGDNTVVIDGTTVNLTGNAVAWYSFTPEAAGTYTFACSDLTIYILTSKNMGDVNAYVGNGGVADLEAGVTYHILLGKEGITGEFTVNVSVGGVVAEKNTMVVGENHYVITDALLGVGYEFLTIEITEPGTYIIEGGAPMKVYFFTVLAADVVETSPFGWNVDAMEESGFATSFEVTLSEAGTYMMGFNYEYVTEESPREYDINISLKAEEPPVDNPPAEEPAEMNFFQKIIAWLMDLINKLLAIFNK